MPFHSEEFIPIYETRILFITPVAPLSKESANLGIREHTIVNGQLVSQTVKGNSRAVGCERKKFLDVVVMRIDHRQCKASGEIDRLDFCAIE